MMSSYFVSYPLWLMHRLMHSVRMRWLTSIAFLIFCTIGGIVAVYCAQQVSEMRDTKEKNIFARQDKQKQLIRLIEKDITSFHEIVPQGGQLFERLQVLYRPAQKLNLGHFSADYSFKPDEIANFVALQVNISLHADMLKTYQFLSEAMMAMPEMSVERMTWQRGQQDQGSIAKIGLVMLMHSDASLPPMKKGS